MTGKTPIYEPLAAGDNDDWDIPVATDKQLGGGIKVFNTIAERDAWAAKYPSRLPDTMALVGNGENKYPSWYKWETTWHFEGYFGGMVLADTDGALTRVDSTAVFGPDFEIQAAGDQGNGILIMLSAAAKAELAKKAGVDFKPGPYLELVDRSGGKVLEIKPGSFELHKDEARLAYFDNDEVILGGSIPDKRKGAIWADVVSYGRNNVDIYADIASKSVTLQDPYADDPSVTGGAAMLCLLHLEFYGKAPNDGQIEIYRVNAMTGDVLVNDSGQPMGFIHHYKQHDDIKPITIAQIYMAKGAVNAQWVVKHTFSDDPIKMKDWDAGGSCMLDMYVSKESVNPALNEVQSLLGKPVRVQSRYYGTGFASNKWEYQFVRASQEVAAGAGQDSVIGIDFENPTKLKVAVTGSNLNIKDANGDLAYFNTGLELSEEDTANLRGKEVKVSLDAFTRYNALNLCMFTYTGNMADVTRPIVTGWQNMSPTLSAGWDSHDHAFLAEHPEGQMHPLAKNFVIPNQAKLVMFGVVPVEEQSPMDITLGPMTVDVVTPFTAHEVTLPLGQDVLYWGLETETFVTHGAKIWQVSDRAKLPLGEVVQGKPSGIAELNVVEDDASKYDGGLQLNSVTEYSIEVWLNVQNYFKTDIPSREEVTFTIEDVNGTVVSTAPALILEKGDFNQHVVHWKFDYTNESAGNVLTLYGNDAVTKSVYLVEGSYHAAGIIVTAKVAP